MSTGLFVIFLALSIQSCGSFQYQEVSWKGVKEGVPTKEQSKDLKIDDFSKQDSEDEEEEQIEINNGYGDERDGLSNSFERMKINFSMFFEKVQTLWRECTHDFCEFFMNLGESIRNFLDPNAPKPKSRISDKVPSGDSNEDTLDLSKELDDESDAVADSKADGEDNTVRHIRCYRNRIHRVNYVGMLAVLFMTLFVFLHLSTRKTSSMVVIDGPMLEEEDEEEKCDLHLEMETKQ